MSVKERTQFLTMTTELVREHMPVNLDDSDLCKDMCAVVAINLRRVHEDAEQSAKAWDKRTFHTKAEELRSELGWALPLSQIAEAMAYTPKVFEENDWQRLNDLLPDFLELPAKPRFKDVEMLRGSAAAARQTMLKRK